jgi:catechol 2,3-dioxygenase-like lactoylglutathione lyase family enzyme
VHEKDITSGLLRWPSWVGVVCQDLQAQRRFYRDVLGLSEKAASSTWVLFELGPGRTFELLALDPSAPQYDGIRYQVGFDVGDIRAARSELTRLGVEPITEIEGNADGGGSWVYFRDLREMCSR